MKKYLGLISIITAATFWGTTGFFVNTLKQYGLTETQILLGRALFAAVLLLIYMLIFDRKALKIKLKDLWLFAACGIFCITFFNLCYYKTIGYMGLSVAAVLMYTAPIFVMIISVIFFKEKLTVTKVICCLLAVLGCALVSGAIGSESNFSFIGLVFGLLTGFGYSLLGFFSTALAKRGYNSYTINFYSFLFVAIAGFLININDIGVTYTRYTSGAAPMIAVIVMGLINTFIPYVLYSTGLKTVRPSVAVIVATFEPAVATVFDMALYKKFPDIAGYLGIFIILTSVLVLNLFGEKEYNNASENEC